MYASTRGGYESRISRCDQLRLADLCSQVVSLITIPEGLVPQSLDGAADDSHTAGVDMKTNKCVTSINDSVGSVMKQLSPVKHKRTFRPKPERGRWTPPGANATAFQKLFQSPQIMKYCCVQHGATHLLLHHVYRNLFARRCFDEAWCLPRVCLCKHGPTNVIVRFELVGAPTLGLCSMVSANVFCWFKFRPSNVIRVTLLLMLYTSCAQKRKHRGARTKLLQHALKGA